MKKIVIVLMTLIGLNQTLLANIDDFAHDLGIPKYKAKEMIDNIVSTVLEVEEGIKYIGNSNYAIEDKKGVHGVINNVRSLFVTTPRPTIEISKKPSKLKTRYVRPYLTGLANLANKKNIVTSIKFLNRLHFDSFYKQGSDFFFKVSDYQYFKRHSKYNERKHRYSDVTKKSFYIEVKNNEYLLHKIRVEATYSVREYNRLLKRRR